MAPKVRSLTGLVLAVIIAPALLGVLACMPVPVGNPERSRIDPELTGVWLGFAEEGAVAMILDPYDKRTWHASWFTIEWDDADDAAIGEHDSAEKILELVQQQESTDRAVGTYKVWLTRLGGARFMTWEYQGIFDEERGFEPEFWFVFRVDSPGPGQIHLKMVDSDSDFFDVYDEIETRRQAERVIRRHADDEELYGGEHAEIFRLYRARPEHYDDVESILEGATYTHD
ncbi:MAG: hypothetical protein ACE5FV_13015 [Woeseia sp.]